MKTATEIVNMVTVVMATSAMYITTRPQTQQQYYEQQHWQWKLTVEYVFERNVKGYENYSKLHQY